MQISYSEGDVGGGVIILTTNHGHTFLNQIEKITIKYSVNPTTQNTVPLPAMLNKKCNL